MNYGKLTESIYERSVVKIVKTNSDKNRRFYDGTGLGSDCAIFPYDEADKISLVSGQALAQGSDMEVALRSFVAAVNNAIINSANKNIYANMTIMVPEKLREIKVRQILEKAVLEAEKLQIPILSANVQVLPSAVQTMVSCVVSGMSCQNIAFNNKKNKAKPNEDIVNDLNNKLNEFNITSGQKYGMKHETRITEKHPVDPRYLNYDDDEKELNEKVDEFDQYESSTESEDVSHLYTESNNSCERGKRDRRLPWCPYPISPICRHSSPGVPNAYLQVERNLQITYLDYCCSAVFLRS